MTYKTKDDIISSVQKRAHLLLTNDDGANSPGLSGLREALSDFRVSIVAPDRERSAASHSLTLHQPIRVDEIEEGFYITDGTPADCVTLGVNALLKEPLALIISGINSGPNLGDDVTYSGTVSAAMEGVLLDIPSFAISIAGKGPDLKYDSAARVARRLVELILKEGLPPHTFLNVNAPNVRPGEIRGVAITTLGRRVYQEELVKRLDPRGRVYYWIGSRGHLGEEEEGTDFWAIKENMVSITPLHLDLTNYKFITSLKKWNWEGFLDEV